MFLKKLFGFGPPPYSNLGPQEVAEKIKSTRTMIIDVREPHEYSGGHIKGSKNIPLRQLPDRISQFNAKDQEIIMVCASGGRSSSAAGYLVREGYTNICNLSGGMMSWRRAGLPVKR
jgi:rhodanese-related sulfurtransferase